MKRIFQTVLSVMVLTGILVGCQSKPAAKKVKEEVKAEKPVEWSRNANIYEVNVRQYTPEGTLNAFAKHMPRLKEMGVDILWLMPIYPISEKNRKGSMGSYYAVADYQKVNPEFGTLEDLKSLVDEAHKLGMKVILDWVANHTGWDNYLIEEHKDWYTQNEKGEVVIPEGTDWTDTADLNYENEEMRKYMTESLKYWVVNADVDGFRCDVAGMVPTDFWEKARVELDAVKPVFMLAEDGGHELLENAFDMGYGWEFHHIMNDVAKGKKTANDMEAFFHKVDTVFPADSYTMNFTTNHDENSWNGTTEERMGEGAKTFAVLTFTMPGMPLIYSGQEAGLNKRLKFFEKDEIDWSNLEMTAFYKELINLKKNNKALWNGVKGGKLVRIPSDQNEKIFAFTREADGNKVVVMLNLSKEAVKATLDLGANAGNYACYKDGNKHDLAGKLEVEMKPWEYRVYVK
jgi:glycosidase